jgi:hypothetical protein
MINSHGNQFQAPLVSKFWDYSFFAFMNLMYGLLFYCSARIFCHVHTNTMAGGGVERIHTQINVVLALQVYKKKHILLKSAGKIINYVSKNRNFYIKN